MKTLLILTVLMTLVGCATPPAGDVLSEADEAWLLDGAALREGGVTSRGLPDDAVLAITPEMGRFAETAVRGHGNERNRIRALLTALVSPALRGITYDPVATFTPEETFRKGRANCLSFTTLYVLLARHVGLRAAFNEVDVPPIWDMQSPETLLLYKHVNALVRPERDRRQVIDLDMEEYDSSYPQREIPDTLAAAQYFNNRAMELMFDGQLSEAQRYLAKAISLERNISYFWGNLGSLYWRAGDRRAAELAFRKAMHIHPADPAAISNASRLYAELGHMETAQRLEEQVANHRRRNPYYRYQQGLNAFVAGDYESARSHALAAIDAHRREHRFHFLLGAAYTQLGDEKRARDSFDHAIELTADGKQASAYRHKIDMLLSKHL
jgi:Flp pilus assembly protein TadD